MLVVLVINGFTLSVPTPNLPSLVVLKRRNEGLDFGAYFAGIEEVTRITGDPAALPSLFGFMNCGITGPFLPAYLPRTFDWFGAYAQRLNDRVKLVGAYVTCLRSNDAGGYGPKVEGHSFFTDRVGLRVLLDKGVIRPMVDKHDAIVEGEYGMSRAIFEAGYSIDTQLYRYQVSPDSSLDVFSFNVF
jgi:hypothetical protein